MRLTARPEHEPTSVNTGVQELGAGSVVASWRLVGLLHESASSRVWEAEHVRLHGRVALKFLRHAQVSGAARATCQVRSPHVVQVLSHGTYQGAAYLVMELLEGEDLGRLLARERRLRLKESARIVDHLCRALQSVHDLGFVHGQLKPENVFVIHEEDGGQFVKLLDFDGRDDVAAQAEDSFGATLAAEHATPHFCSPEQLDRSLNPDRPSDVWSLAALAYRMLTGVPPFAAASAPDVCARVRLGDVSSVHTHLSALPVELDQLFARCFQVDPAARMQSVREISAGLYEIARAHGERIAGWIEVPMPTPVQAQDARCATPETLRAPRARKWSAVVACLALLGAALLWWSIAQRGETVDPRATETPLQPSAAVVLRTAGAPAEPARAGTSACASAPADACAKAEPSAPLPPHAPDMPEVQAAPIKPSSKRAKTPVHENAAPVPEGKDWGF